MSQQALDALSRFTGGLHARSTDDARKKAALELRDFVLVSATDLPHEQFIEFYKVLTSRITQIISHGSEPEDRLGGIYVLDALIEIDDVEVARQTTRFAQSLRGVLRGKNMLLMEAAATALGKMCRPGGSLVSELVESEVSNALEWLHSARVAERRYSAVLVLRELSRNAPTLMYGFVGFMLDQIWTGLRDIQPLIRQTTAEVASACFQIIRERDQVALRTWQAKIYVETVQGIGQGSFEHIHGSLLVIEELLKQGGSFMHGHYLEICETVFRFRDHGNVEIRRTVVILIPELAHYSPTQFSQSYLHKFMVFLLGMLKKDKDRNSAFLAVGNIAAAVTNAMLPYLDVIMKNFGEVLSLKVRRSDSVESVFDCLGKLAVAIDQALIEYMETLLDQIFACELSAKLTQALVDMACHIPHTKPTIQERLLDMLSKILCGQTFKPIGAPTQNRIAAISIISRDSKDLLTYEHRQNRIKLALTTLGSFDFSTYALNEFVRDVAIKYVEDESPDIRKAAILTCCQLFACDPIINQASYRAIQVVGEVVQKLLTVSVADSDPGLRKTVLTALDKRFDKHLARTEHIRTLFFALNDEVFGVREAAIAIIGRLTHVNPAYIIPSLRKVLIQILTELEISDVVRDKGECAKLLSLLVQNSKSLIKPYIDPIISVLLPKAQDPSPALSSIVLTAIGELATVGGEDMIPYIDKLMPVIIEALKDQSSSSKREATLRTLGQLASSSGYVIKPYIDYPQLLDILQKIIRGDSKNRTLRQEAIKVLGILGALDPYRHQLAGERSSEMLLHLESAHMTDISLMVTGLTPSNRDYFPTVVINALLNILKDQSLVQHHYAVIEAIMSIFRTVGLDCISFLDKIIPAFLSTIRNSPSNQLESYFSQLGLLVMIVQQHIRSSVPDIVTVLKEYWNASSNIQTSILHLIETISRSLEGEFRIHLSSLLPLMLTALENDISPRRLLSERVLHAFMVFGSCSQEYLHLVMPVVVGIFEKPQQPLSIRKSALETIGIMSQQVNLNDYASLVIHSLARVLAENDSSLQNTALTTLCALIFQLGDDYLHFMGTVNRVISAHKIQHQNYELLVRKLLRRETLPLDLNPHNGYNHQVDEVQFANVSNTKLSSNPKNLKASWDSAGKSTTEDWKEWMRRFSITVLGESSNHALRSCAGLASVYPPLSRELFNSAFISCWSDLLELDQYDLIQNIETAMRSPHIPPDILGILLKLAEFMEHDDKALPIDIRILGREAGRCQAWAKALHYKELEFGQDQTSATFEALIDINNQLQQYDAAKGFLRKAQLSENSGIQLRETWFEKLGKWEEALAFYKKRELEHPDLSESLDITMGKMRCLHALGEWDSLSALAQDKWQTSTLDIRRIVAPLATTAAWSLGKWDRMDEYLSVMKNNTPDRTFFGAILALHRNQFVEAARYVKMTREGLEAELSSLVSESYNRAYNVIVRVQMLAELEELITYKQSSDNPDKQESIRRTLEKRLLGCQRNIDVWQRVLRLQGLVISPKENLQICIKFANLCRKAGRMIVAEKELKTLTGSEDSLNTLFLLPETAGTPLNRRSQTQMISPHVKYAVLKYQWAAGKQTQALESMESFTSEMAERLEAAQLVAHSMRGINELHSTNGLGVATGSYFDHGLTMNNSMLTPTVLADYTVLLSRCFLKQGEWQIAQKNGNWRYGHVHDVLSSYRKATNFNPNYYKAWHAWALANFEVIQAANQRLEGDMGVVPRSILIEHVTSAIRGFFQAIALSNGSPLQDSLRLLTLWFSHGGIAEVNAAVTEGFTSISVDTWLEVIPQLIARIDQPNHLTRQSLHRLLTDIGRAHPQALVYSLTVAMKSAPNTRRSRSVMQIMDSMRQHSTRLVRQADMVSRELIRVAVLWHEQWHEGLDDAYRLYFGDHNIEGMLATLAPLHNMLDQGPETLHEISFAQLFGRDLQEAREWCYTFRQSGDVGDINQAWDLYYQVFKRIQRQLLQVADLELSYVSPGLLHTRNLDLAVPGTYQSGKPIVRILSFETTLSVINSKQRPRKITLNGSNGTTYSFLLKGREDMRQDERVMQFFGLCNTLLTNDSETYKRHLSIQRCSATPLSQNSGLLGWFPNIDTLHVLIKEYRESRKILLNIETRIMLQMAPDYDNLTLLQKIEVFGYALDNTTGQDLYRVLWLKSKSSESWLERRTNYTRSLGVMSIVGYILGLGDRHPSNLMLDKITGNIIHIDFGDCFEVAMHRDKYPERVPFRLTRMLTYAMEVSNIEGSFRITCENVMRVLRENKDSLTAVLEAFIHDPLLNWRITSENVSPPVPSLSSGEQVPLRSSQGPRTPSTDITISPSTRMAQAATQAPSELLSSRPGTRSYSSAAAGQPPRRPVEGELAEIQNERAIQVLRRVKDKLTGRDFKPDQELTYIAQVDKLLIEATKLENLCQHYFGWCSFW